jgi:AcrR family transcriptional regulator
VQTRETRGRPRIRDDDDILRAAVHAFAEHGYEGMSLRTLNADLGLSRGTINQRFRSKEQLWYAAVDHEFRHLIEDINAELQERTIPDDDLSLLREGIVTLITPITLTSNRSRISLRDNIPTAGCISSGAGRHC